MWGFSIPGFPILVCFFDFQRRRILVVVPCHHCCPFPAKIDELALLSFLFYLAGFASLSLSFCPILASLSNFSVFGCLPVCFSNADLPSVLFSDLRANSIFDISFESRCTMMCLFLLSLMFTVFIILSNIPFPLWTQIGQITCWMNLSARNRLRVSPVKTVPESFRFLGFHILQNVVQETQLRYQLTVLLKIRRHAYLKYYLVRVAKIFSVFMHLETVQKFSSFG